MPSHRVVVLLALVGALAVPSSESKVINATITEDLPSFVVTVEPEANLAKEDISESKMDTQKRREMDEVAVHIHRRSSQKVHVYITQCCTSVTCAKLT